MVRRQFLNIKDIHLGDNCIQNFNLGRYIVRYTVGNFRSQLIWIYTDFKTGYKVDAISNCAYPDRSSLIKVYIVCSDTSVPKHRINLVFSVPQLDKKSKYIDAG